MRAIDAEFRMRALIAREHLGHSLTEPQPERGSFLNFAEAARCFDSFVESCPRVLEKRLEAWSDFLTEILISQNGQVFSLLPSQRVRLERLRDLIDLRSLAKMTLSSG